MAAICPRNPVNPLWVGVEIPHLPEERGEKDADPQGEDRTPVAAFRPLEEGFLPSPGVNGFEDEVEGNPQEGEEDVGECEHQSQHDPAGEEKSPEYRAGGRDDRPSAGVSDEGEGRGEFCCAEDCRNDGGEVEGRPEGVGERRECGRAFVEPVLCAEVEGFEEPPDGRGKEEKCEVFSLVPREEGGAAAPIGERVYDEGVSEP